MLTRYIYYSILLLDKEKKFRRVNMKIYFNKNFKKLMPASVLTKRQKNSGKWIYIGNFSGNQLSRMMIENEGVILYSNFSNVEPRCIHTFDDNIKEDMSLFETMLIYSH